MMTTLLAVFLLGCAFGAAARAGRFCLLRGVRGWMDGSDRTALRAFALALAVALAASQGLQAAGAVDLTTALPVRDSFALPGMVLGGVLFGWGMVLANACGARALVLGAGGNMRALVVVLVMGVTAQASLGGVLAPLRLAVQGVGTVTPAAVTLPGGAALAVLIALALAAFALGPPALRARPAEALAALLIGLCVAAGWWITTHVGTDPFDPRPPAALSFVGPLAEGGLYLMIATGISPTNGAALVAGTLAGALATALATRSFRLESFTGPRQMLRMLAGAVLMGFGGVLALGCSIGQGLSGLSTLAIASLPACAGILAGIVTGLRLTRAAPRMEVTP